jgi:competence protein ComEA
MSVSERITLGIPLDISVMNEVDFDKLPGIGPALAQRIIEFRQNNGGVLRVTDLAFIEGIGEKKYRKIKEYF